MSIKPGELPYPDLVSDAVIDGFGIVDGVAKWTVLHEQGAAYFLIEETSEAALAGNPIAFEPHGLGAHVVAAEFDPLLWYRLIEVDTDGNLTHLGSARPKSSMGVRDRTFVPKESSRNDDSRVQPPIENTTSSGAPTLVIFADDVHLADVDDIAASWESSFAQKVEIHSFDGSDPSGAREEIHDQIKQYYQQYGTTMFHIIAGADVVSGEGDLALSVFLESSDQELADLNYDGLPDVVVTRWPSGDAGSQWLRMMEYNFVPTFRGAASTSFFVEDLDQGQYEGSGALTQMMVDDLKGTVAAIRSSETLRVLKGSSYPDFGDRNIAAANHINSFEPELIVLLATRSGSATPGHFFNRALGISPQWSMGMLSPSVPPTVVLGASCSSAQFSINSPFEAVCNDFVGIGGWYPLGSKGAVAWMGSFEDDTDQTANHALSKYVLEEFFDHPYRPMAESWLTGLTRAYEELGSVDDYRATLNRMIFLGDPLSAFKCLPRIRSFAKPAGTQNLLPMPATLARTCPAGDNCTAGGNDRIVVEIAIAAAEYEPLAAQDLAIGQPRDLAMAFYPDNSDLVADAAPSWDSSDPDYPQGCYKATFTIDQFGGCGESLAPVKINGEVVGHARIHVKSPDVILQPPSRAKVNLADFGVLGSAYTSSKCNCVYPKTYNSCVDFVAPDTTVNLPDFTYFSLHYDHGDPQGEGYGPVTPAVSTGNLSVDFLEERPLVGERLLRARISVENIEPFRAVLLAMSTDNPVLEFSSWHQDAAFSGETICTEVVRSEGKRVFLGVLGSKNSPNSMQLGEMVFRVNSDEDLDLTGDDLEIVIADVLTTGGNSLAMSSPANRTFRPSAPTNSLAQNYPNPFNPSTTIAFSIAKASNVELAVYDVGGRRVRTLIDGPKAADHYRVEWDGLNDAGTRVASGIYFCRLRSDSFGATKKMILIK